MPDERAAADQVVAFWDALVLDQPTDDFDVDAELAAALECFQSMGSTLPTTARERVWQGLQPDLGSQQTGRGAVPLLSVVRRSSQPAVADSFAPTPRPRRGKSRWILSQLATAALLVVTLGLGYVTLGPGRSDGSGPVGLPAVIEAPAPESTLETLFATTLPADQMPTGAALDFVFTRLSLDPGASAPVPPEVQRCCTGPQIVHVLAGELTVRVDGPMRVYRGALATSVGEATPGAEVVLRPGDTVVFDFALPTEYANHGSRPAQLVAAGLYAGTMPGPLPGPWTENNNFLDANELLPRGPLPPGPAEIRLVRATLPPDGTVPAPPTGALVLEVGAEGDAAIATRVDDSSLHNIGDKPETIYVMTVAPVGKGELTP